MVKKSNSGKTAILVIHGIGEQRPFETLDSFSRGLVEFLRTQKRRFSLKHEIVERRGSAGVTWNESLLQIHPHKGTRSIDIHEFYWAYLTEQRITVPEVLEWVEKTLQGTRRFYRENKELQRKFEKRRKTPIFPLTWVAWALRVVTLLYPLYRLTSLLFKPVLPLLSIKWVAPLWNWLAKNTTWIIVGYIGDIAIYTTTDEKSRKYRIRQQILKECQSQVEAILEDSRYDRVIIAGHSLGSVIAFDTLNRINIKSNLPSGAKLRIDKITGLITFGSPLDKIAFFFREHTTAQEYIRRQIKSHLHSFKAKTLDDQNDDLILSNPIQHNLDDVLWVNYYSKSDPISGHLDFYQIAEEDNVLLDLPEFWGVAHVGYWTHQPFYEDVVARFL
jgi:hypothetical protein